MFGLLFTAYTLPVVAENAIVECTAERKITLFYSPEEVSSPEWETDNLSDVSLGYDFGFVKLFKQQENETVLLRQSAVAKIDDNFRNITIRYDIPGATSIERTSMIIVDPMCINRAAASLKILQTGETYQVSSVFKCACLSQIHDRGIFIPVDK